MSTSGMQRGAGRRRVRREVIEVVETKAQDKSLDKLMHVRKQRLERLERERREAREAWRATRTVMSEQKIAWRTALQAAKDFWIDARAEFLSMTTTSGDFRKAKAIYQRMQAQAAQLHADALDAVKRGKRAREAFFDARFLAVEANLQQEKLKILREEMRKLQPQPEM
ncbi:MAG: hypothetical protein ACREX0_12595 [Noviherbaspirillum sp.]